MEKFPRSIMQDWTQFLGLRHQGVLVAAVRGCDTAPKESGSKTLSRYLRSVLLNAHVGDPRKSRSFIQVPKDALTFGEACDQFFDEMDALPLHYVMHLAYAAEIVGYHHPGPERELWGTFYQRICKRLHVNPESRYQLDARLDADENAFAEMQKT